MKRERIFVFFPCLRFNIQVFIISEYLNQATPYYKFALALHPIQILYQINERSTLWHVVFVPTIACYSPAPAAPAAPPAPADQPEAVHCTPGPGEPDEPVCQVLLFIISQSATNCCCYHVYSLAEPPAPPTPILSPILFCARSGTIN